MEVKDITFYTVDGYEETIEEPKPCFKQIPKWYVETTNVNTTHKKNKCPFVNTSGHYPEIYANIKTCPAVFDYLTSGYIIPAWDNFVVRNVNDSLYMSWQQTPIHTAKVNHIFNTHQTHLQADGLLNFDEQPLYGGFHKLLSPWFVQTPPGISLYVTNPNQYRDKRFTTVDAVIHPDKHPMSLQWFFEWNKSIIETDNFSLIDTKLQCIKKGTPLMLIIPFRREQHTHQIKYMSEKDYQIHCVDTNRRYTNDWFNNTLYNSFRKSIGRLFR